VRGIDPAASRWQGRRPFSRWTALTVQRLLRAHSQKCHDAAESAVSRPPNPLPGYRIVEITLPDDSPAAGTRLSDVTRPPGYLPVSLLRNRHLRRPDPHLVVRPGDRIALLTPEPS
jgi:hypothetical protein